MRLSNRMMRRAYLVGIVVLGLAAVTVRSSPAYGKLVSSAARVQSYVESLSGTGSAGNSLSPIERFVFSLVLANEKTLHPKDQGTAPVRRT
jgi:hypothetical protein